MIGRMLTGYPEKNAPKEGKTTPYPQASKKSSA